MQNAIQKTNQMLSTNPDEEEWNRITGIPIHQRQDLLKQSLDRQKHELCELQGNYKDDGTKMWTRDILISGDNPFNNPSQHPEQFQNYREMTTFLKKKFVDFKGIQNALDVYKWKMYQYYADAGDPYTIKYHAIMENPKYVLDPINSRKHICFQKHADVTVANLRLKEPEWYTPPTDSPVSVASPEDLAWWAEKDDGKLGEMLINQVNTQKQVKTHSDKQVTQLINDSVAAEDTTKVKEETQAINKTRTQKPTSELTTPEKDEWYKITGVPLHHRDDLLAQSVEMQQEHLTELVNSDKSGE